LKEQRSHTRSSRVADLIKEEVANLFLTQVGDPRVQGITITDVRIGDDLKLATIYYVSPNRQEEEQMVQGLGRVKGFVRSAIAKRINLRRAPEIEFRYDDVFEQGMKMENLFREIKDGKQ
jgi:ribosome-binding factor A